MSIHSGNQSNFSQILHSLPDPTFGVKRLLLRVEDLLSGLGGVRVSVAGTKEDRWVSVDKASLTPPDQRPASLTLCNEHICY